MRRNMAKLMMVALSTFLIAGGLMGCNVDKNIGKETHPNIGDASSGVRYKVESDEVQFNIDGVSLDYYFGGNGANGEMNPFYPTDKKAQFICFALNFYDGQYYNAKHYESNMFTFYALSDYHDIEGYYFIKTLLYDEFNSDEYYVVTRNNGKHTFNHHETITVPREVFERESGSFVFQITEIWFSEALNQCGTVVENSIFVDYDFIDEQTIRLSKPSSSTPR